MKPIVNGLLLSGLGGWLTLGGIPALAQDAVQPVASHSAAQISASPAPSSSGLISQGRTLYQQRRWQDAIATWQMALTDPTVDTTVLNQAAIWSYLGMAYHKLGEWSSAEEAIATSHQRLQDHATSSSEAPTADYWHLLAQTLNAQAQLDFIQGQLDRALGTWQQTTQIYRDLGYTPGVTGSLINQARVLEVNGYYHRACETVVAALAEGMTESPHLATPCDVTDAGSVEPIVQMLDRQANPDLQILGWRSLGNALRLTGHLAEAQNFLERSLALAQAQKAPHHQAFSLLSLAQVERDRYEQAMFRYEQTQLKGDRQAALTLAEQVFTRYRQIKAMAETTLNDDLLAIQAGVQHVTLLTEVYLSLQQQGDFINANQFRKQLQRLPALLSRSEASQFPSRPAIYSQINLAQSLIKLRQSSDISGLPTVEAIARQLTQAHQQAIALQDSEAQSYALGTLGTLYEYQARKTNTREAWQQAQQVTEAALALAQATQTWHIAYQWQWQLGRIHNGLERPEQALTYYQAAASTLRTVRQDLLTIQSEVQFSFRDNVEPLYREWVSLLVGHPDASSSADLTSNTGYGAKADADASAKATPSQHHLQQAIQAVDALRLSELENFLSCNLTPAVELSEPQVDAQSAVLYPIILSDELVVIMRSPQSETLHFHRVALSADEVDQTLRQFRQQLENRYTTPTFFARSQQIYDWLIRPFESLLDEQAIQTLVFVADGGLRNVPMAALHDGDRFLIEEYAIATSPGLQLPASEPLSDRRLGALTFGLSEIRQDFPPHQGFAPLVYVEPEVEAIQTHVANRTLLNQNFTQDSLQALVESVPFPIVHLATHGQFSSDPENTFLLAWDQTITVDDLSTILQNRDEQGAAAIELLVLSACKTADGDNRATLGLAGIAIQSGARSTIASLWYVDDQSTSELMRHLYQELATSGADIPRAEALRRAQVKLLNTPGYQAPTYWAPYILVGNWL